MFKQYLERITDKIADMVASRVASKMADISTAYHQKQTESLATLLSEVLGRGAIEETSQLYVCADATDPFLRKKTDALAAANKGTQILLSLLYKVLVLQNFPLPKFADVEFRCFSQSGEDGILLYIFALIGSTNKQAVEICAGDGTECNAANLILNHGWVGLLMDGDAGNVKHGEQFYGKCQDTSYSPPTFVNAWITAEDVNSLIQGWGFEGEIDLLSLDLDGVDYWIWKAIDCIQPRVVVVEYNTCFGPHRAVTVQYSPDFRMPAARPDDRTSQCYFGASLPAFVKLGREKGYRLVGCQRFGFNAFFIRSDIGVDVLPEMSVLECFELPHVMNYRGKEDWQDWLSNPLSSQLVEV